MERKEQGHGFMKATFKERLGRYIEMGFLDSMARSLVITEACGKIIERELTNVEHCLELADNMGLPRELVYSHAQQIKKFAHHQDERK